MIEPELKPEIHKDSALSRLRSSVGDFLKNERGDSTYTDIWVILGIAAVIGMGVGEVTSPKEIAGKIVIEKTQLRELKKGAESLGHHKAKVQLEPSH